MLKWHRIVGMTQVCLVANKAERAHVWSLEQVGFINNRWRNGVRTPGVHMFDKSQFFCTS